MEVQAERSWSRETLSYNTKSISSTSIKTNMRNCGKLIIFYLFLFFFFYLSAVSFFAGGELLFFESVDSRLQEGMRHSVNLVLLRMFVPI